MQPAEQVTPNSDYWRIIKERKSIVIIFFVVAVLTVTISSFLMKPIYRATVKLLIDVESPNVLTTTGSMALGSPNYLAYKEYFRSQKEIMKNRSIARQIFEEFKLDDLKKYRDSADPLTKFLKTIKVESVRDTRLLFLHVEDEDPGLAADLANRIAHVYIERNLAYISKSESLNLLKNEYLKLQAKLAEDSKVYKAKHPKMIRLKQELEQTAVRIREEKERGDIYDLSKAGVIEETAREDSELVLAGLKANNVSIQDLAEVPVKPQRPKKRLNILFSMIIGLFGGAGLALVFDYLEDTIKTTEDIKRLVAWPFLGNVPDINGGSKLKLDEFQKDLFTHIKPKDPVAEVYRTIRSSVSFLSVKGRFQKSIVITSLGPQEGKTTTLCNLGVALAQSEKKVLLVDADMRKSRLHEVFRRKDSIGLSSFLSGQAEFDNLVQETHVENLFLVPAGPIPPNPSELLSSQKIKVLIDKAKENFDVILFDTPPVAVVTDAAVLSQLVDGVIIVIESGKTIKKTLTRINQVFTEARARIIGYLINRAPATRADYYYSHYYNKD